MRDLERAIFLDISSNQAWKTIGRLVGREHVHLARPTSVSNTHVGLVREPLKDEEGLSITSGSHVFDSLSFDFDKIDIDGDSRSTPQTSIDENTSNHDSGKITSKENMEGGTVTPDDSHLFDFVSARGVSSKQLVSNQQNTSIKSDNNAINLDKTNVKASLGTAQTLKPWLSKQIAAVLRHNPTSVGELRFSQYHCKTEQNSISSIYLDVRYPRTIYRWEQGSVITFNVNCSSFPNSKHARHAVASLKSAAEEWNKGDFGVRFKRVEDHEPAVFQLVYSASYRRDPTRLAQAFFPGDPPEEQQLCVYESSFNKESGNWDYMANMLCHELGHVLGLRHEFAPNEEHPFVQLGKNNRSSIMNYFESPSEWHIQETDYHDVRRFYRSCANEYGGCVIVDEKPRPFALRY